MSKAFQFKLQCQFDIEIQLATKNLPQLQYSYGIIAFERLQNALKREEKYELICNVVGDDHGIFSTQAQMCRRWVSRTPNIITWRLVTNT